MKKRFLKSGIKSSAEALEEEARKLRRLVETEIVELDFTMEELGTIALAAHRMDMTLNQYINYVLERVLEDDGLI